MTKIEFYRRLSGLEREAVADAVGVSKAAVGFWERGRQLPRADTLLKLADVLNVAPKDLLGDVSEKYIAEGIE